MDRHTAAASRRPWIRTWTCRSTPIPSTLSRRTPGPAAELRCIRLLSPLRLVRRGCAPPRTGRGGNRLPATPGRRAKRRARPGRGFGRRSAGRGVAGGPRGARTATGPRCRQLVRGLRSRRRRSRGPRRAAGHSRHSATTHRRFGTEMQKRAGAGTHSLVSTSTVVSPAAVRVWTSTADGMYSPRSTSRPIDHGTCRHVAWRNRGPGRRAPAAITASSSVPRRVSTGWWCPTGSPRWPLTTRRGFVRASAVNSGPRTPVAMDRSRRRGRSGYQRRVRRHSASPRNPPARPPARLEVQGTSHARSKNGFARYSTPISSSRSGR